MPFLCRRWQAAERAAGLWSRDTVCAGQVSTERDAICEAAPRRLHLRYDEAVALLAETYFPAALAAHTIHFSVAPVLQRGTRPGDLRQGHIAALTSHRKLKGPHKSRPSLCWLGGDMHARPAMLPCATPPTASAGPPEGRRWYGNRS